MQTLRNKFRNFALSQSNPSLNLSELDENSRPKTTRSKKKSAQKTEEHRIKVQRMIMDNITRNNEQNYHQKIDVFNLDNTQRLSESSQEGLPKRLVDQIITNIFDKDSMKQADKSKLECSICCTDFEDGDEIKILQCLHTHHKQCIDGWFTRKSVCPDCKFNLRSLDVRQLL